MRLRARGAVKLVDLGRFGAGQIARTKSHFRTRLKALYRDVGMSVDGSTAYGEEHMTAAAEATLPLAMVHGLFHIAIKTDNLAATRRFWTDIIGLKEFPRPDFGYPGAWLGCTQPGGLAIIHVYAGGPALGPEGKAPAGTAAIDHVSLSCSGYCSYVSRFTAAGLDWREFVVPGTSLWQLFVYAERCSARIDFRVRRRGRRKTRPVARAQICGRCEFLRQGDLSETCLTRCEHKPACTENSIRVDDVTESPKLPE
jgi:catechol 2,3-dioxygenase-like lactoylglutathione lyase family enzyme